MPITVVPNRIEISTWDKGWMPDQEPSHVPHDGLLAALNLLPDAGSGALQLRKGYKRITSAMAQGYTIQSIHPYNRLAGDTTGSYLIVVMTTKVDATPGNVLVYAVNLVSGAETLISPNDEETPPVGTKAWESGDGRHWGQTIQETFYGGGTGDPMYSWNPDDGWDDDPAVPTDPVLVDSTSPAASQRASDYAFQIGDRVLFRDPTGTPTQPQVASLTTGDDDTNGTAYATASISPGNSNLVLLAVVTSKVGGSPPRPKVSGCGLTFVEIKDVKFNTIASPTQRLTVFRAQKTAPTTDTIDITYSQTVSGCAWSVIEVDDVATGNNGANAVQTAKVVSGRADSGTSLSLTMDTMLASSSTIGFFAHAAAEVSAPGAGFTELTDTNHAAPALGLEAEMLEGQDTTVDASWATTSANAGVGIEVLAGGAGGLLLFEIAAVRKDKDIRYKTWKSGNKYEKGRDFVSRKASPAGESTYWRSYRCIKTHTADATNRPGDGTGSWTTYWKQVALPLPMDVDGDVAKEWNLIPTAPQTHLAVWHAERLFLRYDDVEEQLGLSRTIFSQPSKPKKGSDISDLFWDPTNFGLTADNEEGDGGGYFDSNTGDGDPITAYADLGPVLLVFKRRSTFAFVGTTKPFQQRQLSDVGAVSHRAHCRYDNLVYFFSDDGLYVTDGNEAVAVPGNGSIREWLHQAVDFSDPNLDVTMWTHDNRVWISLPTTVGRTPDITLVYDPTLEAFYPLDLQVNAVAVNRKGGIEQMFFAPETKVGTHSGAVMAWTGADNASTSTRIISAVTETNLSTDPSFEARRLSPYGGTLSIHDWQTVMEAKSNTTWVVTHQKVKQDRTIKAKLRGKLGMELEYDRDPYVFDSAGDARANRARPPEIPVPFEGIYQTITDVDASAHNISMFVRRKNWLKNKTISYANTRFRIDGSELASGDHTYTHVGRGWYRVSATYTGAATPREHAIVFKPRFPVQLDKAMVVDGALVPYFDGDGTDGAGTLYTVEGGEYAMVHQYDHPDVQDQPFDDKGESTYENAAIPWSLQTSWFPFGVARQERRIRRVWALIRGAVTATLSGFKDYRTYSEHIVEVIPEDENRPVSWLEGKTMPASAAVSFSVEGLGGPVSVLGVAADTEIVRFGRFGRR